jgi:hypothetical protein
MSTPGKSTAPGPPPATEAPPPPVYLDARAELSTRFLAGDGLEIGGLHQPLPVAAHANVRYVDRMTTEQLRREYPELAESAMVEVDVVDDGERLASVEEESQDFIIANHFLEHCQDPIGTIETHLGKLQPGGVLFYAVPDKRYTFDFLRPPTPLEHMIADHEQGPEQSLTGHYDEWSRLVTGQESTGSREQAASEEWVAAHVRHLEEIDYSIHFHVWTQAEFLRLILHCRECSGEGFDIEAATRQAIEFIVVLRKQGAFPAPPAPPGVYVIPLPDASTDETPEADAEQPPAPLPTELQRWISRARRVLVAVRNDVRRWRKRP